MPRKKTIEFVEQTIHLSDEVTITARWPKGQKPVIKWDGDIVTVALSGAVHVPFVQTGSGHQEAVLTVGRTNGPDHDTPEILAMKARLSADPSAGGLRKVSRETTPITTAEVFANMTDDNGKKVFDEDFGDGLTPEGLEAAAAALASA